MSEYSELMQEFIESQANTVGRDVTKSVIERMGGETQFIEDYEHVALNGRLGFEGIESGFSDPDNLIDFYKDNTKDIKQALMFLADKISLNSTVNPTVEQSLILRHSELIEKFDFTLDEPPEAPLGKLLTPDDASFIREEIVTWVGLVIGCEVCCNYKKFTNAIND